MGQIFVIIYKIQLLSISDRKYVIVIKYEVFKYSHVHTNLKICQLYERSYFMLGLLEKVATNELFHEGLAAELSHVSH